MANESKIKDLLQVDDPKQLPAGWTFDANDRRFMDNQIRETQRHVVDSILNGTYTTYPYLSADSDEVAEGDVVCSAGEDDIDGIPIVTLAVVPDITDAKSILGIVVTVASPGSRLQVATHGILPASITGLDVGDPGAVRLNTSTARCERVATLDETDYTIGTVNIKGNLTLHPLPIGTILGIGGGGGGGGSSPGFEVELDSSSATVNAGQVYLLKLDETNKVEKATSTTVKGARGIVGIARSTITPGTVFTHDRTVVPNSITGLGAGDAGYAAMSSSGALVRQTNAEQPRIGLVFTDGSVQPFGEVVYGPINVKDFGAIGDGTTDDSAAIQAALDSTGTPGDGALDNRGRAIYFPPGVYYCASDIYITFPNALRGEGDGRTRSGSRLKMAEYCNVWNDIQTASVNGVGGNNTIIEQLDIEKMDDWATQEVHATTTAYTGAQTASVRGRIVIPAGMTVDDTGNDLGYCYELIRAGTSAGSAPTFADFREPDRSIPWQAGITVGANTVVRGTDDRYDVVFKLNNAASLTDTKVTGSTPPTWNYTLSGTTNDSAGGGTAQWVAVSPAGALVADGGTLQTPTGCVWAVKVSAGIFSTSRIVVRNVGVLYALNAGIYVHGTTAAYPQGNANGTFISGCTLSNCGVGIHMRGGNGNAGTIIGCDAIGIANNGGRGWLEESQLGNVWIGNQCEASQGAWLYSSAQYPVFLSMYSEGSQGLGKITSTGTGWVGGNLGTGFTTDTVEFCGIRPGDCRGITKTTTSSAGQTLTVTLGTAEAALEFSTSGDASGYTWNYKHGVPGAGWVGFRHANSATRVIDAFSTTSKWGPGIGRWLHNGVLTGASGTDPAHKMLGGFTAKPTTGLWAQGWWAMRSNTDVGDWAGWVCTVKGGWGDAWVSLQGVAAGQAVTPTTPNGYVYQARNNGANGSSEPTWPTVVGNTVDSGSVTYECFGVTPAIFVPFGFADDEKTGLAPQTSVDWADTGDTDSGTLAAKSKVRSRRKQAQTTTATADQVLDDGATYGNQNLTFSEGESRDIDVLIIGKRNGQAEMIRHHISGTFYYEGGTLTQVGATVADTVRETGAQISGTTVEFNISGATVRIRTTPANAITIDWTLIRQDIVRTE